MPKCFLPKRLTRKRSKLLTWENTSTYSEANKNPPPTDLRKSGTDDLCSNGTLFNECDQEKGSDWTPIHCNAHVFRDISSQELQTFKDETSTNHISKSLEINKKEPSSAGNLLTADQFDLISDNDQHDDPLQIVDSTESSDFMPVPAMRNTCDFSGKMFRFKSNLYKAPRERRHMVGKTLRCTICDQTFHLESHLIRHARMHPINIQYSPHKCDVCGKNFNHKSTLMQHAIIHTEEKPYKRDVCGKTFKGKFYLKSHEIIHTGEKSYKCDVCGKMFKRKFNLKAHEIIHTEDKPYKCNVCGKTFNQKLHLTRHARHCIKP